MSTLLEIRPEHAIAFLLIWLFCVPGALFEVDMKKMTVVFTTDYFFNTHVPHISFAVFIWACSVYFTARRESASNPYFTGKVVTEN